MLKLALQLSAAESDEAKAFVPEERYDPAAEASRPQWGHVTTNNRTRNARKPLVEKSNISHQAEKSRRKPKQESQKKTRKEANTKAKSKPKTSSSKSSSKSKKQQPKQETKCKQQHHLLVVGSRIEVDWEGTYFPCKVSKIVTKATKESSVLGLDTKAKTKSKLSLKQDKKSEMMVVIRYDSPDTANEEEVETIDLGKVKWRWQHVPVETAAAAPTSTPAENLDSMEQSSLSSSLQLASHQLGTANNGNDTAAIADDGVDSCSGSAKPKEAAVAIEPKGAENRQHSESDHRRDCDTMSVRRKLSMKFASVQNSHSHWLHHQSPMCVV